MLLSFPVVTPTKGHMVNTNAIGIADYVEAAILPPYPPESSNYMATNHAPKQEQPKPGNSLVTLACRW